MTNALIELYSIVHFYKTISKIFEEHTFQSQEKSLKLSSLLQDILNSSKVLLTLGLPEHNTGEKAFT